MVGGRAPREWKEYGIPLLVIEILSPRSARQACLTRFGTHGTLQPIVIG